MPSQHLQGNSCRWRNVLGVMAGVMLCLPIYAEEPQVAAAQVHTVDFNRDILPLFVKSCFACHGNDGAKRKAGLRLDDDSVVFKALASGKTPVVPGHRDQSELFQRITTQSKDDRMPPVDSGKSLSPEEIERIGRWIDQGGVWEQHWSLKPIVPVTPPQTANATWARNDIDRFILARLEHEGLQPSPEADRRTLIRRLSYDLLGLPPTPEEVDAFINDSPPDAYEKLVDRLLASPRYGERWARHWLDIVHYGETHGYDKDKRRNNAWPYRDYVIEAFNTDKPYSRFILEQIAGDTLFPDDPKAVIAQGFISAGPWDFVGQVELREGTKDKNITRLLDRDDMVTTAMNTFVSITVQCARCHDHKFDPIQQKEYYGLQAVFAGVDRTDRPVDTDPTVYRQRMSLTKAQQELRSRLNAVNAQFASLKSPELDELNKQLEALKKQIDDSKKSPSNGYHSAIEQKRDVVKWVQVDLGASLPIDAIFLVPAMPTDFADTPGFGFPVRFKIESSDDPDFKTPHMISDQTGADYPNNADMAYSVDKVGATARYVRVTATRLWERTSDFAFALSEMRVISAGKNAALHATVTALDSIEDGRWSKAFLVDGYTSRAAISNDGQIAADTAGLEAQYKDMNAKRDALINSLVDAKLITERAELNSQSDAVAAQLKALPEPQMVYTAANDYRGEDPSPVIGAARPVHVLRRGDVSQEADDAVPCALACVTTENAQFAMENSNNEGQRRAALAEWIANPKNPLTWRSIVNRVWQFQFGQGIVDTPSDFGHMGAAPTHPELLDWLAYNFLEHGQSLKWLHKQIVMSATYRQVSANNEAGEKVDAGNQLLWRMNRTQLDAESLRDSMLAVSGKLNLTMGGPGYDLFVFKDDHSPGYYYDKFDVTDPKSFRRSIYRFIVRSVPDPFMECLDCADPSQNVPVRNATITALQALALLNDPFVLTQAKYAAERVASVASDLPGQLTAMYRLALGRDPNASELQTLSDYAQKYGLPNACRVILNCNEFMFVD